jgi:hypothetical protein
MIVDTVRPTRGAASSVLYARTTRFGRTKGRTDARTRGAQRRRSEFAEMNDG